MDRHLDAHLPLSAGDRQGRTVLPCPSRRTLDLRADIA
jgi:hypothetical protein